MKVLERSTCSDEETLKIVWEYLAINKFQKNVYLFTLASTFLKLEL